jgi:hypothetical protein
MNKSPYRNFGRRNVQTGSGRAPLIIAIAAALITYAALGPQTPFGFLHHLHRPHIAISTDKSADAAEDARQAAEDRAQEEADGAQDMADRARELGERAKEKAQVEAAKAVAAVVPPAPIAPPAPAVPAAPATPAASATDAEVRTLDSFDSVTLENNASATITIGDTQSVSVSGGVGHTETRVHDGKLIVSGTGTQVAITVPHLKALQVNGFGKVSLAGLRDPVTIKANGAVELSANGMVDSAELVINGPSKLDFAKLQARNLTVQVNGVGDADVYATENLVADVKGVGHVRYRGDPHLVTKINGPGTVQRVASDAG